MSLSLFQNKPLALDHNRHSSWSKQPEVNNLHTSKLREHKRLVSLDVSRSLSPTGPPPLRFLWCFRSGTDADLRPQQILSPFKTSTFTRGEHVSMTFVSKLHSAVPRSGTLACGQL